MATINLGSLKFNWTGAYNSSTSYAVDDVATANGNSYVCIQAHSNQAVGNATAYWNIMSSAGTNGTDVGATLANKEIAFKTNAGAVDGIPIGTAGQFLKVNSGATGYEYGAVSSDIVKLAQNTTGNATSISMDGYFSSTYKSYKVIYDLYGQNHSTNLGFRFNVGGSTGTASNYIYSGTRSYRQSSSGSITQDSAWDNDHIKIGNGSGNSNHRAVGEINIYNVGVGYPQITTNSATWNNTTEFYGYVMQGLYSATTSPSGFTLFYNTGATIIRSLTLYGLK